MIWFECVLIVSMKAIEVVSTEAVTFYEIVGEARGFDGFRPFNYAISPTIWSSYHHESSFVRAGDSVNLGSNSKLAFMKMGTPSALSIML